MVLNYRILWCVLLTIGLMSVEANPLDSLRTEKYGDGWFIIHKVEQGETLYSLARRYGVELPAMKEANKMDGNSIHLGQELRIPAVAPDTSKQPESSISGKTHTVVPGETLYAIGRKYGVAADAIKEWNSLNTNEIEVGQQLIVSSSVDNQMLSPQAVNQTEAKIHQVGPEETLYAISRKYGVEVSAIKEWNSLSSNEIAVGQELIVSESSVQSSNAENRKVAKEDKPKKDEKKPKKEVSDIPEGFNLYYVQTGDLLETIASKYKVRPDSIVIWNKLPNTYLTIGQKLLIRGEVDRETMNKRKNVEKLGYGTRRKVTDQSGFSKIIEEGSARKIEDVVETQKYLALHRSLPIGSMIEVRNLMNNQKIFVRVVGKLPETGLNKNVLVRLTPICFERLGVIDPMTRVELSYYED